MYIDKFSSFVARQIELSLTKNRGNAMILFKKTDKLRLMGVVWLMGYGLVGMAADKIPSLLTKGAAISFTSVRIPSKSHLEYPYNTIGKLWFNKSDGTRGVCTASLIRPGIVATAGHCVHSGNGSATGYSYNFRFAPGYHNGIAPYGVWSDVVYRNVPTGWYKSGGKRPNGADYALLVFAKDSVGKRMGDVTGWWLGWKWNNNANVFIGQRLVAIGYTQNLDKGEMLHKVDSIIHKGSNNTGIFGSNLLAGSDGSPIILDFGKPDSDYVFSVVSYSAKATLKQQVGSLFNKRFGDLLDVACTLYFWACDTG